MSSRRSQPVVRGAVEAAVVRQWKESRRTQGTIQVYLAWVHRFLHYQAQQTTPASASFSIDAVRVFARWYATRDAISFASVFGNARAAVRAWTIAMRALGHPVPAWKEARAPLSLPPLVEKFVEYRVHHGGVSMATAVNDGGWAVRLLQFLQTRRRRLVDVRLLDLDRFFQKLGRRMVPKTLAGACSSLRAFLRFLRVTGRIQLDLAVAVASPRVVVGDRPPKTIAWSDVQHLVRTIDSQRGHGARDRAVILLMVAYGFGAAEVAALDLDDVDWKTRVVHVRRPKTGTATTLPLLPAVGRALAQYISYWRPRHAITRALFVMHRMPHRRLTTSAIRHRVADQGKRAGLEIPRLGGHVLRHTHASRQIDLGAPPKVVSDILGHSDPSSTSAYVRVAFRRLRAIALPVPR